MFTLNKNNHIILTLREFRYQSVITGDTVEDVVKYVVVVNMGIVLVIIRTGDALMDA